MKKLFSFIGAAVAMLLGVDRRFGLYYFWDRPCWLNYTQQTWDLQFGEDCKDVEPHKVDHSVYILKTISFESGKPKYWYAGVEEPATHEANRGLVFHHPWISVFRVWREMWDLLPV